MEFENGVERVHTAVVASLDKLKSVDIGYAGITELRKGDFHESLVYLNAKNVVYSISFFPIKHVDYRKEAGEIRINLISMRSLHVT